MSLVRVITRLPEYPTGLVRELRSRGFDVETCAAHDSSKNCADLEVTLDCCSPRDPRVFPDTGSRKDLHFVISQNVQDAKHRSFRIVIVSAEEAQNSERTMVPEEVIEICTALVGRSRQRARTPLATRLFSSRKAGNLLQSLATTAIELGKAIQSRAQTAGRVLIRVQRLLVLLLAEIAAETGRTWRALQKSAKECLRRRREQRGIGSAAPVDSAEIDPELVPSLFNLSPMWIERSDSVTEVYAQAATVNPIPPSRNLRLPKFTWRRAVTGLAAAAIILGILWLSARVEQSHTPSNNLPSQPGVGSRDLTTNTDHQAVRENGDVAESIPPVTPKPSAAGRPWMTRASHSRPPGNGVIAHFGEDVTVRHFKAPVRSSGTEKSKNTVTVVMN